MKRAALRVPSVFRSLNLAIACLACHDFSNFPVRAKETGGGAGVGHGVVDTEDSGGAAGAAGGGVLATAATANTAAQGPTSTNGPTAPLNTGSAGGVDSVGGSSNSGGADPNGGVGLGGGLAGGRGGTTGAAGSGSTSNGGGNGGTASSTGGESNVGPAPRRRPQTAYELWNGDSVGAGANVNVCFLWHPRQTLDGETVCALSNGERTDCGGNIPTRPRLSELRITVQRVLVDTWQRAAGITLVGFEDCAVDAETRNHLDTELASTIAIAFAEADAAEWVGRDRLGPTVVYVDWRRLAALDYGGLIHEFGHALGFADHWNLSSYVAPDDCAPPPEDHTNVGFLYSDWVQFPNC